MIVTPWNVEGNVDYDKLVEQFGVQRIDNQLLERIKKHTGELHLLLRRGIFFAHRDLNWLLDEYEKGNSFYLYTGRGPSSGIHLGHLIPLLFTKWLQDKFNVNLLFQITDDEKYLFKDLTWEQIQEQVYDNIKDMMSLGFDKNKTKFIIDTKNIDILYPIAIKIAKKINFSTVKAVFGFTNENNIGQIFYTSLQAVPSVLKSVELNKNIPCLIPHGIDQDPHFRISRDVLPKLGFYKPASIQSKMLPSLTGESKSSSSSNSSIYLTDSEKEVKTKVMKYMLTGGQDTLENQRKLGGNPEKCVVFQYFSYLFEEDDKELEKRYNKCKNGELICGQCKKELLNRITLFLKNLKTKKAMLSDKILDKYLY